MKCNYSMDDIINYTEQILSSDEAEAIKKHLESCKKCRDYYNTLVISENMTRKTFYKSRNIENMVIGAIDKNRYKSRKLLFRMGSVLNHTKSLLKGAAAIAVISALVFAVLSFRGKSPVVLSPAQTETPQVTVSTTPSITTEATSTAIITEKKTITVYFGDSDAIYVIPEKREVEIKSGYPIEQVIFEELVKGPNDTGLHPSIPKGTRLISASTANGICTINLSKEFVDNSPGGTASESITLNSVVNSLTELPGVKKVQFLIEGKKREVYTHAVFDQPLTRVEISIHYPESNTEYAVRNRANEAVKALRGRDMSKLSELIHPDKGVRFSAYSHVDTEKDLTYSASRIANAFSDTQKYTWGSYDGSGNPIEFAFEEYFNKFIYDKDFGMAPETAYNKLLGIGNTLVNIKDAYPEGNFVEYYFSSFDPQYSGMDWECLRLVLENKNGTWYVVGILHDQWTI